MGAWQSQCSSLPKEGAIQGAIDRYLSDEAKESRQLIRVLVLGRKGAGVSTIINTMRILYGDGVGNDERMATRSTIFRELIHNTISVIDACRLLDGTVVLEDVDSRRAAETIQNFDLRGEVANLPEDIAHAITILWNDEQIRRAWDRRGLFQVWARWGEFAAKCADYPNWGGMQWVPSVEEYFATRKLTDNGVVEDSFRIGPNKLQLTHFQGRDMLDTFRKWCFCFEGVTTVGFVADISDYDNHEEAAGLEETLHQFEKVCNSKAFDQSAMLLLLNKADIFREKLTDRRIPLNVTGKFPDAPNGFDFEECTAWLRDEFLNRVENKLHIVFVHVTTGPDPSNMRAVLEVCKHAVLQSALKNLKFSRT